MRRASLLAWLIVGCSLDGLADGAGGGSAAPSGSSSESGGGDGSGGAPPSSVGSGGLATASASGGGGAGGATGSAGGGGSVPDSPLLAWVDPEGSAYSESTLGTDRRISTLAVDDVVVVARVIDEDPDPETGARRDRLELVGLSVTDGAPQFSVSLPRHGGDDDDALEIGRLALRDRVVAIPLVFRGILDLPLAEPLVSDAEDGVALLLDLDDPEGPLQTVVLGGAGSQVVMSVAFAADGDVLLGGRFADTLNGCPGGGTGLGDNRGFVARVDAETGACLRVLHYGNVGAYYRRTGVRGLAVFEDEVMAVGGFVGNLTLGTTTLTAVGESDAFLVRFDIPDDTLTLRAPSARRFGGEDPDLLREVVSLGEGAFAMAGQIRGGDLDDFCGGSPLPDAWHAVVLRVGAATNCNWSQALHTDGSSATWSARSLAMAGDGALLLGGVFRTLQPCAETPAWTGVDADGFVLALDPADGRVTHGVRLGAAAEQTVTSVTASGAASSPIAAGSYDQVFDPLLPVPTSSDLFVGRLQPMPALPCAPP
jgi:hypothetical protein